MIQKFFDYLQRKNIKQPLLVGYIILAIGFCILLGTIGYWNKGKPFSYGFYQGFKPVLQMTIVFLLAYIPGFLIPKTRTASSSVIINAPINIVWEVINDYENKAQWYDGIKKTEKISDNPIIWRNYTIAGEIDEKITKSIFPNEIEIVMDPTKIQSFFGVVKRTLKPIDNKTELTSSMTLTESNPAKRTLGFLFGIRKQAISMALAKFRKRAEYLASSLKN